MENRNHHKRDASAWQEDRHRHRKPNAALNLALTRNVLLALIPFEEGEPLAHYFEIYHRHRARPFTSSSRPLPSYDPCQPDALGLTTFCGVPARKAFTFATVVSNRRARAAFAAHA